MKLAITGKGGAGKTTVAAIMARTVARLGWQVVAVDADPNPNLGLSLGLSPPQMAQVDGIVNVLLREKSAHQHSHDAGEHEHGTDQPCEPAPVRTADEIVEQMGVVGPDGVVLVETGRIERPSEGCLCCGSHGTTRRIFHDLSDTRRVVLADLEAGVNDLIWANPGAEDLVLVVTEPYLKSLEVARRSVAVARQMGVARVVGIANRVRDESDVDRVSSVFGDLWVFAIPDDPAVADADRLGTAPMDLAPPGAAVVAVQQLTERLIPAPG
ncbi:MAG: AAA family ATPase [Acidimicrobiales bacterium]